MKSPLHDTDRRHDTCHNLDCADCHPETWPDDDYEVKDPWWWPWMIALAVAIVAVAIVVASGAPRP